MFSSFRRHASEANAFYVFHEEYVSHEEYIFAKVRYNEFISAARPKTLRLVRKVNKTEPHAKRQHTQSKHTHPNTHKTTLPATYIDANGQ